MQKIKAFLFNLPPIFRNLFFLTGVAFAVWMLFFDENNMLVQYNRRQELIALQKKTGYYKREITKVEKQYQELTTAPNRRKNLPAKTI